MNRKKMYEKPSVEVVKLQVQNQLLTGSGVVESNTVNRNDYNSTDEQNWN